jgi:hypothetical protein
LEGDVGVGYASGYLLALAGRGGFSVSANGTLAYRSSQTRAAQLVWFDRTGNQLATLGEPGYARPSLSPDGRNVVVERADPQTETTDIWLIETTRGVPYPSDR